MKAPEKRPLGSRTQREAPTSVDVAWLEKRHICVRSIRDGSEQVPRGAEVARLAEDVLGRFPWLFPAPVDGDLKRLATACRELAYERLAEQPAASGSEMAGLLKRFPEHSALLGGGKQAGGTLWLRAALLRWMLDPRCFELRSLSVAEVRSRLCRFLWAADPSTPSPPLLMRWLEGLGKSLETRLRVSANSGEKAFKQFQENAYIVYCELYELSSRDTLDEHGVARPLAVRLGPDESLVDQGIPLDDIVGATILVEQPPPEDDTTVDTERERLPRKVVEGKAADFHLLCLSGPLCPDTDRVLTTPEAQASQSRLLEIAESCITTDMRRSLAAFSVALSGITQRKPARALRCLLMWAYSGHPEVPDSSNGFSIASAEWVSTLPPKEQLSLPALADRGVDAVHFEPVVDWCRLPMPARFQALLQKYREVGFDRLNVVVEEAEYGLLQEQIQSSVTPRFTIERFRKTLSSAVAQAGRGTFCAQIVAGDALGHSTAPLHYYSVVASRIRSAYAAGIKAIFSQAVGAVDVGSHSADHLIGAPHAAIRQSVVRSATDRLRRATKEALRSDDPVHRFNALSVYHALMFAACAMHRQTVRLSSVTRWNIDEERMLAVLGDKVADASDVSRPVVLTSMVVEQGAEVVKQAQNLMRHLARSKADQDKALGTSLALMISGQGPLFSRIDPETRRLHAIDRDDMQQAFASLPVPTTFLRARGATQLLSRGTDAMDIYRQLGHALDADLFGPDDPESVSVWARRVRPALEGYLKEDGWTLIRSSKRAQGLEVPDRVELNAQRILEEERLFRASALAAVNQRRKRRKTAVKEIAQQAERRLDEVLSGMVPGYVREKPPTSVVLRREDVAVLKAAEAEWSRSEDALVARKILIRRLKRHCQVSNWTVPVPGPLFEWFPRPARITPACVAAADWTARLLQDLLTDNRLGKMWTARGGSIGERLALGAVLVVAENGLTSVAKLRAALRGLASCCPYPLRDDALLVPLAESDILGPENSFGGEEGERRVAASVTLCGLSAIFAARIADDLAKEPGALQAAVANLESNVARLFGSHVGAADGKCLETMCAVVAMGRRLTYSGVLCALQDGTVPAHDLPPKRLWELAVGGRAEGNPRSTRTERVGTPEFPETFADEAREIREKIRLAIGPLDGPERQHAIVGLRAMAADETRSAWVRAPASWLAGLLASGTAPSAVYEYATVLVSRVLRSAADNDLGHPDAESLALVRSELTRNGTPAAVRDRKQLFARLLRHARHFGWEPPDIEPHASESLNEEVAAPPYLTAEGESNRAREALLRWDPPGGLLQRQALAVRSICLGGLTQCLGLRTGEAEFLQVGDFFRVGDAWFLMVRPNHYRELKTLSSKRPLRLDILPEGLKGSLDQLIAHAIASQPDRRHNAFLFSQLTVVDERKKKGKKLRGGADRRIPAWSSNLYTSAIALTGGPDPSRLYAGRHMVGCFWMLHALCPESPALNWPAFRGRVQPAEVLFLVGPTRLVRASRQLGHALVTTTLTHYFHFAGELLLFEYSRHEQPQPVEAVARVAGMTAPSLRNELAGKVIASEAFSFVLKTSIAKLTAPPMAPLPQLSEQDLAALTLPKTALRMTLEAWARFLRRYWKNGLPYLTAALFADENTVRRFLGALVTLKQGRGRPTGKAKQAIRDLQSLSAEYVPDTASKRTAKRVPPLTGVIDLCRGLDLLRRRDEQAASTIEHLLDRMLRSGMKGLPCADAFEAKVASRAFSEICGKRFTVERRALSDFQLLTLGLKGSRRQGPIPRVSQLRAFALVVGIAGLLEAPRNLASPGSAAN